MPVQDHDRNKGSGRLRPLAGGLLALLAVVLLLEAGARLAGSVRSDLMDLASAPPVEWYSHSAELGWEPRPGYSGEVFGSQRSFDQQGLPIVLHAGGDPAGAEARVLFIGDSNTFGIRVPAVETFPAQLERLLPGVRSFNLGLPGYTSVQGALLLARRLQTVMPQVVVIGFNYNDRRYVTPGSRPDSGEWFAEADERRQRSGWSRWLDHLAMARVMNTGLRWAGLVAAAGPTSREPSSLEELVPRVSPDTYRRSLLQMAAQAGDHGAAVVFLSLEDSPLQVADLRAGVEFLAAGRLEEAERALRMAIGRRNMFSDLARIHLARGYRMQGREEDAATLVEVADPWRTLHGGTPVRMDREYAGIMDGAADEAGVILLDVGSALAEMPWVYTDFGHFDGEGHAEVARLLAETLRPLLPALAGDALPSSGTGP